MKNEEQVKKEILELIKARTKICPIKSTEAFDILVRKCMIDKEMSRTAFSIIFRKIINTLRQMELPILASSRGYWWAETDEEKSKYVQRFEARLKKAYWALSGVRRSIKKHITFDLFDTVGDVIEKKPVG